MSDLQAKFTELKAQLAAAKGELEAAQAKAAESADLHEKLNHLTRARAAQDLVSSIESEIASVQSAISEAKRREHRQELLERARTIAREVEQHQGELQDLLDGIAKAVAALQRQAPGIINKWRSARERWLSTFAALEPGAWPGPTGDIENSRRLEALRRVLAELGDAAEPLTAVPPGLSPSNRAETTTFEPRNWSYSPPETPKDFGIFALDSILSRPFAAQPPASVAAPDPAKSI
ncbi:hypothetical protein [Stenotrophomonas maltophilia]|uniref:Uncharacterized protein n=2 Tax=Pseudomonadati TaxID=3379134 RepID=A0A3S0ISL9_STEMA|nr:hypothetical protein [Stenotrophomonas maltophilia]RTQ81542.1 hypothetical protein EKL94_22020 [Stenotrophomonas maltophilia]